MPSIVERTFERFQSWSSRKLEASPAPSAISILVLSKCQNDNGMFCENHVKQQVFDIDFVRDMFGIARYTE